MSVKGPQPRIGVFVCHCGHNIAGVVDVERVAYEAGELEAVVVGEPDLFCCSEPGQQKIRQIISEKGLDRIVVAACSPRLHGVTFQRVAQEAGLNPYLVEMANIREHVSWVHSHDPEAACKKAGEILRMAVARVKLARALEPRRIKVLRKAVVVGGGVAGLSAALAIADAGTPVVIVERDEKLGGRLKGGHVVFPSMESAHCVLSPLLARAASHRNIEVITRAQVKSVTGVVGNFHLELKIDQGAHQSERDLDAGAVVLATGFRPFDPKESTDYPYAGLPDVVTTIEAEEMLKADRALHRPSDGRRPDRVAFIQCIGSREEEGNRYCSRVCCMVTLKQAAQILDTSPDTQIFVHHRDIRVVKKGYEDFYRRIRARGVTFIRGLVEGVEEEPSGALKVTSKSDSLDTKVITGADMVILSVGMLPGINQQELREIFKIPRGDDGFFLEAHPKLRPVETVVDGVYLAGACQGPKDFSEAAASGAGAAGKALTVLKKESLVLDARLAVIDEESCIGCGVCAQECPIGAVELFQVADEDKARVNAEACKGCGVCSGGCPTGAAVNLGFTDEELMAEVDEALHDSPSRKIIAFMCNWCSYAGADFAGVARIQYPESVRIVRVMCSGRVSRRLVMHALDRDAAAVLVAGCHPPGDCHYISGNLRAQERIEKLKKRMEKRGMDPERVRLEWISANEGAKLARVVKEMVEVFIGPKEAAVG